MNIFKDLRNKLEQIILEIASESKIDLQQNKLNIFTVEPCKDKKHGDLASNLAMIFAKDFQKKPYELAADIVELLKNDEFIESAEIAGAGFINIVLKKQIWYSFLTEIISKQEIELPNLGKNEKINLEYASPNPTGPMHVGHTRGLFMEMFWLIY